ncbi:hypothetical protein GCM10009125_08280 [Castellaniella daejeonensis]|uniref:Uncharacterized protein n=1 Tax=Castellaniella daejeonensis TaxID=659013 RepID=A0ABN0TGZ8_9BURK
MFLGLGKDEWEIVSAISAIFGVLVTASAVGVSLWLALRTERYKLKIHLGIRVLITEGSPNRDEYLCFDVVNCGRRIVKISGFGWQMGRRKKNRRHWIQIMRSTSINPSLPKTLDDGENAIWLAPLHNFLKDENQFRTTDGKADFNSLRGIVLTSTGQEFLVRPEPLLLKKIIEFDQKSISQNEKPPSSDEA